MVKRLGRKKLGLRISCSDLSSRSRRRAIIVAPASRDEQAKTISARGRGIIFIWTGARAGGMLIGHTACVRIYIHISPWAATTNYP